MRKAAAIIPSRYQSRRFPGKPLAPILGKPMLQRVYEGVCEAKRVDRVIIATDDERILNAARDFGAEAWMTAAAHQTGTERVAEVARGLRESLIINVQGDEPLIAGEMIDSLVEVLQEGSTRMASLMAKVEDMGLIQDPNIVKVVVDRNGFALYFSRSPLPFRPKDYFFQHVGVYGFRRDFLLRFVATGRSRLEETENLEQLRALENGYRIRMVATARPTLSVDTPGDIIKAENVLRERQDV
ncbi:MAG: 3-deoxy-manno-octulosonate cytidylyltransferase [Candidatus Aminicenantes bacterium]|nr:3-deoxy-manno-octulosonate cytidylyltransferase [Candidatus Aminicenantes bacterium]